MLAKAQAGPPDRQHRARRHHRRSRARRRAGRRHRSPVPRSTCSPPSRPRSRRCSRSPNVVVTPHLGASTVEAQDKAGQTIAEMVVLALAGEFVPFAVNLAASRPARRWRRSSRSSSASAACSPALAGGVVDTLEVSYEGQIADYDCKVLTLAALKGVLGTGGRRAGELRERARDRGGARARRAGVQGRLGPRLREPRRASRQLPGPADPRGGHAVRQAGRAAHRRHRRPHHRRAARRRTWSWSATTTCPGSSARSARSSATPR